MHFDSIIPYIIFFIVLSLIVFLTLYFPFLTFQFNQNLFVDYFELLKFFEIIVVFSNKIFYNDFMN